MQEAVSNSYVFTIVIVIIGLCAVVVSTSVAYSKTFKIKNRIVSIIEKYDGYSESNEEIKNEIDALLKDTGYSSINTNKACPKNRDDAEAINTLDKYRYCVYEYNSVKGKYYSVATFLKIDFPLIGDYISIEIPVYGETKVIVDF